MRAVGRGINQVPWSSFESLHLIHHNLHSTLVSHHVIVNYFSLLQVSPHHCTYQMPPVPTPAPDRSLLARGFSEGSLLSVRDLSGLRIIPKNGLNTGELQQFSQ